MAGRIAQLVAEAGSRGPVLGLATGASMAPVYSELVRRHREQRLGFAGVTTFNLDEYLGLPAGHPQAFRAEMAAALFDHVDVARDATHFPGSDDPAADPEPLGPRYEQAIAASGGIDLQLLGIGRNGHIAFNEPGSPLTSRTRVVALDDVTRRDAAVRFGGLAAVPRQAITMGIATILECRRVILLAFGQTKAQAVARALQGPVGPELPASFLRCHAAVEVHLDGPAAAALDLR